MLLGLALRRTRGSPVPLKCLARPLSFTPDGRTLACASVGAVILHDAATGKRKRTLTTARLAAVWGTEQTGTALRERACTAADLLSGCAFAPDGRTVALFTRAGKRPLSLWTVGDGRPRKLFGGLCSGIDQATFTPDGATIIATGSTPTDLMQLNRHLKFWDAASGKEIHQVAGLYPCVISGLCLSPGGRLLAASGDDTIKVWDLADLMRPERAKQPVGCR